MDTQRKTLFKNRLTNLLDSDTDKEYYEKLILALEEITFALKLFKEDIV